jgi:hypothetical protein
MDYSIQTLMLASLGMNGSAFLSGNQTASNANGWLGFKTVDGSVVLGGITGVGMSGVSYLVGRTIPHPTTIYGKIINIAVASGSSGIQLLN